MKDYDYVTIYLPYNGQTQRSPGSQMISEDCLDWIQENVGSGTTSPRDWLLAHDTDEFNWCYAGIDYSPESHHTALARIFYFKDINNATMFKLIWGG